MTDWNQWLERWEAQQSSIITVREQRFAVMLEVLDCVFEDPFVVLDLASGPGAISRRVLERFPQARCVAVDIDPVLLSIGRNSLGDYGGRLRWVEADLRGDWTAALDEDHVDAALSTTALHWLPPGDLVSVYQALGRLVRPGGVYLDGDNMQFPQRMTTIRDVADQLRSRRMLDQSENSTAENYQEWWKAAGEAPEFSESFAERERRFAWRNVGDYRPGMLLHEAALEEAGFRETAVVYQYMQNRVLMAVR